MRLWPFGKSIQEKLNPTKKVKICGIHFVIKKINIFDYMNGSKVLLQSFQTYEEKRAKEKMSDRDDASFNKKIMDHYKDVFMAGVIEPKLSRKEGEEGIFVDNLFTEPELIEGLYVAIIEFTYGKKKLWSQRPALVKSS